MKVWCPSFCFSCLCGTVLGRMASYTSFTMTPNAALLFGIASAASHLLPSLLLSCHCVGMGQEPCPSRICFETPPSGAAALAILVRPLGRRPRGVARCWVPCSARRLHPLRTRPSSSLCPSQAGTQASCSTVRGTRAPATVAGDRLARRGCSFRAFPLALLAYFPGNASLFGPAACLSRSGLAHHLRRPGWGRGHGSRAFLLCFLCLADLVVASAFPVSAIATRLPFNYAL